MAIELFIDPDLASVRKEIEYVFRLWSVNTNIDVRFTNKTEHTFTIGSEDHPGHIIVSNLFKEHRLHENYLSPDCYFTHSSGKPDHIATAFFMVNALQEYNDTEPDSLGRFQYKNSYQSKFKNASRNIVQECFDQISNILDVNVVPRQTSFFLTHDVDLVNSAWLEDGFNVLKKGRIDIFLKFIFNMVMAKPDWLNMDKIMKLESTYDCKSVFYWLVNKGKLNAREQNADYRFHSSSIQKQFASVVHNGFENGLHKSLSPETFQEEIKKYGAQPIGNRYHYLKFNLPHAFTQLEKSGLTLDTSLGFAEEIGFRNSYGLPFNPYNILERKPYAFIEVPLHVMDRTLFQYNRVSLQEAEQCIICFFEKNKKNCVLTVLWHNNFFTEYKYKGYLGLYKKILAYIKENNFSTISQEEIIRNFNLHM